MGIDRDNGAPNEEEPTKDLGIGRDLLVQGDIPAAIKHLCRAFEASTGDPEAMSWYGLALAKGGVDRLRGVVLCEAALRKAAHRPLPELYHNLGQAYLVVEYRAQAADVLRQGASRFPEHEGLMRTLVDMGLRRRPVLPFLSRRNPVNKYLGLLRHRLLARSQKE